MIDFFWNAGRGLAKALSRFSALLSPRNSLFISGLLGLFLFFSETELSKILDQRFASWAAVGSMVGFAALTATVLIRNWQRWAEHLKAVSDGALIEILVTGTENPFLFENTRQRGPLHGEILHYKLMVRITALRNLRLARARLIASGLDQSVEDNWEDFRGHVPKGHEAVLCAATLQIEARGMTSGPATIPHSECSPVSIRLCHQGEFREVSANGRFEIEALVRHASGEFRTTALLWIWSGVPTPARVLTLRGRLDRAQVSLEKARSILDTARA